MPSLWRRQTQNNRPRRSTPCYPSLRPLVSTNTPKLSMEGTHKPTNAPSSLLPVNHRYTENRNDAPAATVKPIFATFMFILLLSISTTFTRTVPTTLTGCDTETETILLSHRCRHCGHRRLWLLTEHADNGVMLHDGNYILFRLHRVANTIKVLGNGCPFSRKPAGEVTVIVDPVFPRIADH